MLLLLVLKAVLNWGDKSLLIHAYVFGICAKHFKTITVGRIIIIFPSVSLHGNTVYVLIFCMKIYREFACYEL